MRWEGEGREIGSFFLFFFCEGRIPAGRYAVAPMPLASEVVSQALQCVCLTMPRRRCSSRDNNVCVLCLRHRILLPSFKSGAFSGAPLPKHNTASHTTYYALYLHHRSLQSPPLLVVRQTRYLLLPR